MGEAMLARAVARSEQFCMERQYLTGLDERRLGISLRCAPPRVELTDVSWLRLQQVGTTSGMQTSAECSLAMQKILYAAHEPGRRELLFLTVAGAGEFALYIGLRNTADTSRPVALSELRRVAAYVRAIWPGLVLAPIRRERGQLSDKTLRDFTADLRRRDEQDRYSSPFNAVRAVTGIPSVQSDGHQTLPMTLDRLLAGLDEQLKSGCHFAYLVIAQPVDSGTADSLLERCRDLQAETSRLQHLTISETRSLSEGTSSSSTMETTASLLSTRGTEHRSLAGETSSSEGTLLVGEAESAGETENKGVLCKPLAPATMRRRLGKLSKIASCALSFCPEPLGETLSVGLETLGALLSGQLSEKERRQTSRVRSEERSASSSESSGMSVSTGTSRGFSRTEGSSRAVSITVEDPHIAATMRHLERQAARLEQGKALGLWDVGAYVLAEESEPAAAAAAQLRSILSGLESTYEPIRTTDISVALSQPSPTSGTSYMEATLAALRDPRVSLLNANGHPVEHPLGSQFTELRTLLTTRELSYYVNFPERNVPGLQVMAVPTDFDMREAQQRLSGTSTQDEQALCVGKVLDAGARTALDWCLSPGNMREGVLIAGSEASSGEVAGRLLINSPEPFLVVETTGHRWLDWSLEVNHLNREKRAVLTPSDRLIDVYAPGREYISGYGEPLQLGLNPLYVQWPRSLDRPPIAKHFNRLLPLLAPLFSEDERCQLALRSLLLNVYRGQLTSAHPSLTWPTVEDLLSGVKVTLDTLGLSSSDSAMVGMQLSVPLEELCISLPSLSQQADGNATRAFARPAIVNLGALDNPLHRRFVAQVLLLSLLEWREQLHERTNHLTLLPDTELLGGLPHLEGETLLGMTTCGQAGALPHKLTIALRQPSSAAAAALSEDLALSTEQGALLRQLPAGQAIVAHEGRPPLWVELPG